MVFLFIVSFQEANEGLTVFVIVDLLLSFTKWNTVLYGTNERKKHLYTNHKNRIHLGN